MRLIWLLLKAPLLLCGYLADHFSFLCDSDEDMPWVWEWSTRCMGALTVPVFIPVDSPDHSNANAHSSQHKRPHWEVPVPDGEARKRHKHANTKTFSGWGWSARLGDSETDKLKEGNNTHSSDSHDHNVWKEVKHSPMPSCSPGNINTHLSRLYFPSIVKYIHVCVYNLFWKSDAHTWLCHNQFFPSLHPDSWTVRRRMRGRI